MGSGDSPVFQPLTASPNPRAELVVTALAQTPAVALVTVD